MIQAKMLQAILVVVGLISLDVVLGWLKALVRREWSWAKVADYLRTAVLPFVGGLLALALLAKLQPSVEPVFYASVAATSVKLVADIITKIAGFGVPVEKKEG